MKQQGGTFSTTIPCTITYEWWPEEKATEFEPGVEEEFTVMSFKLGNTEVVQNTTLGMDWAILKYLKGEQ